MKFAQGVMVGTLISAGIVWMYAESNNKTANKLKKKSKNFLKNMI